MTRRMLSVALAGVVIASTLASGVPAGARTTPLRARAAPTAPVNFTVTSTSPGRVVVLKPVEGTKTTGSFMMIYNKVQNQTVAVVAAIALPSGGRFFPKIMNGPCGANSGVVASLPDMQATSHMTGTSAGTFAGTYIGKQYHFSLYRKWGAAGMQRKAVACANMY